MSFFCHEGCGPSQSPANTTQRTTRTAHWLLSILVLVQPVMGQDEHTEHNGVLVFTTHALPRIARLEHADQVFYLDAADAVLKKLTFANPGTEARARERASTVLQTPEGEAAIAVIQHVGEGISLAWQHGIRKLPAVMVGGNQVVYGVFDVGQALALIQQDVDHEH